MGLRRQAELSGGAAGARRTAGVRWLLDGGVGLRRASATRSSGRSSARCGWVTSRRRCWRWWRRSSAGWRWARSRSARASRAARGPRAGTPGCELAIALWSLLLIVAMPPFSGWVAAADGRAAGAGVAMVRWRSAGRSCCCCPRPPRWAPRCRRWSASTRAMRGDERRPVDRRRCTPATRSAPSSACSRPRSGWFRRIGLARTAGDLRRAQPAVRRGGAAAVPGDASQIARARAGSPERPRAARRRAAPRSRSPACWGSATRCSSCACSARSRKTPSTRSRCCSRSTWWAARRAPPATSAGSPRAIASARPIALLGALAAACLVGTASLWARRACEGGGAATRSAAACARPSRPRRCWRSSPSGRRRW